jgi:hypothetical protein
MTARLADDATVTRLAERALGNIQTSPGIIPLRERRDLTAGPSTRDGQPVGIEDEVRKELDEQTSWPPGAAVRFPLPSGDDPETRMVKLEMTVTTLKNEVLRLARELDDLAAKSG